ncbi:unnamed protein product [Lasius platythorax]|uniref:Peptidase aspartic putative domain-containing protein n=1 Tax=Lasius platythorax TaxID=488582 RepID=A0AAV2MWW6_9HYME
MRAFLSSTPVTKPSGAELKRLSSAALQARRSFESFGRPVKHWDDWFVHVVVEKLDSSSRLLWEASLQTSSEFPTLTKLQDFLQTRIRALEAATPRTVSTTATASAKSQERKTKMNSLTTSTPGSSKRGRKCSVCQGNHLFNYCTQFKELTVSQRREHVKKQGACFNCLKDKHSVSNCPSGFRCARCQGKHHTLLHLAESSSAMDSETTAKTQITDNSAATGSTSTDSSVNVNVAVHALATKGAVLLSTAQVSCSNKQGDSLIVRALLDCGSEAIFVTERVARALRLPRGRVHVPVSGIQGASAGVASHSVELMIGSPRDSSMRHHLTSVLVLPKLTSALPSHAVRRGEWPHLTGLELADPHFDRPASVEAVLGADVYGLLLREGLRRGPAGSSSAQATSLGWVLMGHTSTTSPSPGISAFHAMVSYTDVDRTLQRFWELEEVLTEPILRPEEQRCERLFATSHARDPHGRYIVRLPKRTDPVVPLKNNRKEALQQLVGLERRLMRNALLREQYNTFLDEYHRLGHMVSIQANEVHSEDAYYLPHHAVFKKSGPVDKIRVVFNASHRTSSGYALNDLLLPGPKLQSELWIILTRWRLYPYAFTSDIVKMFRQILVSSEDTDLQRILWRADPAQEIQDYRLVTVVYGTASAPYLALRTLLQLADDEGLKYPLGANAIRNHSYVDDILTGGHTLEQALEVRRQLIAILAAGGFSLSKWAANTPQLCPDNESHDKLFHDREGVSTLGVLWRPADDTFALKVASATSTTSCTKRTVLSDVTRFFDPLGWASPVLIFGKIFIQDLWMAGLDWDEPLPDQLQSSWTKFTDTLPELNTLSIPRFAHFYGAESVELHGFSDASCRAYAAAVYLRSTSSSGVIFTHLLVAKTKVAPVKQISIPRLELCGALLLAKLICCTLKGLAMENIPIYALGMGNV